MWSTVYAENFGISLLLLFFAYTSIFHWKALLETSLGKTALLSIGALWVFRTLAEVFLYRIGADGAYTGRASDADFVSPISCRYSPYRCVCCITKLMRTII
jgi:hypothetical protein